MNKKEILKKAKLDPEFRRSLIFRLKNASSGDLNKVKSSLDKGLAQYLSKLEVRIDDIEKDIGGEFEPRKLEDRIFDLERAVDKLEKKV